MGFWDTITDLVEAATPWSVADAEAPEEPKVRSAFPRLRSGLSIGCFLLDIAKFDGFSTVLSWFLVSGVVDRQAVILANAWLTLRSFLNESSPTPRRARKRLPPRTNPRVNLRTTNLTRSRMTLLRRSPLRKRARRKRRTRKRRTRMTTSPRTRRRSSKNVSGRARNYSRESLQNLPSGALFRDELDRWHSYSYCMLHTWIRKLTELMDNRMR